MKRTIQLWAKDAHAHVQYACNLSGIVYSFQLCVNDLAAEAVRLGKSPEGVNCHPICVAWVDKLDDLSKSHDLSPIPCDYNMCDLVPDCAAIMKEVCIESHQHGHGTEWRNTHPRVQQIVRKLVYVTGSRDSVWLYDSLAACERIANGQEI